MCRGGSTKELILFESEMLVPHCRFRLPHPFRFTTLAISILPRHASSLLLSTLITKSFAPNRQVLFLIAFIERAFCRETYRPTALVASLQGGATVMSGTVAATVRDSITFTMPAEGRGEGVCGSNVWYTGQERTITWESSGCVGLVQASTKLLLLMKMSPKCPLLSSSTIPPAYRYLWDLKMACGQVCAKRRMIRWRARGESTCGRSPSRWHLDGTSSEQSTVQRLSQALACGQG